MKTALSLLLCLSLTSAPHSDSFLSNFNSVCPSFGIGTAATAAPPEELPSPPEPLGFIGSVLAAPSEEFCQETARKQLAQDICDFALEHVGYDYLWGGTTPEYGFDCSGFVQYVYAQFGYELNRIAEDQALNGVHVEEDDIRPGDVLCFYSNKAKTYIGHVGIYLGDRLYIHAQNEENGVIVSDLDDPWLPRTFEARRIV